MTFNIPTDKLLHYVSCLAIFRTFDIFGTWVGAVVSIVFALGKEFIWDKWWKKGTFEWQDLNYDFLGIITGVFVSIIQYQVLM